MAVTVQAAATISTLARTIAVARGWGVPSDCIFT